MTAAPRRLDRSRPGRVRLRLTALAAGTAAALVATAALVAVPASAEPEASGDGWSVEQVGDSYEVTVELDGPLGVRAAAPTVVVDGEEVGTAFLSEDGATLTAITDDPRVLQAQEVGTGWQGEAALGAGGTNVVVEPGPTVPPVEPLAVDPAEADPNAWLRTEYDIQGGVPLDGIGGESGELAAVVHYPAGEASPAPVVVVVHGRGPTCLDDKGAVVLSTPYPCAVGTTEVPALEGYESLGESLASHGFVTVSIGVNGVAPHDQGVADRGASARAGVVREHLDLLAEVSAGGGRAGAPVELAGRIDLGRVGLLGHSRGGEGVVRAAQLAAARGDTSIASVMLLAPTDMSRLTLPGVPTYTMLPYCDGDVVSLQGQHYYEDSRYAFDDDVLRSTGLVMGANHNFFNTALPRGALPPSSPRPDLPTPWMLDDWNNQLWRGVAPDPVCTAGVAGSQRLGAATQVDVRDAYATAWFRLTLGGERDGDLASMFDGTGRVPAGLAGAGVQIFTVASAPRSARIDVARLVRDSPAVTVRGSATATICASLSGAPVPSALQPCAGADRVTRSPHWAPTANSPSSPAGAMLDLRWTARGAGAHFSLPTSASDVSVDRLSFRAAPSPSSTSVPDLRVVVRDEAGAEASVLVSEVSPALQPLPGATEPLGKTYLRTVSIPLNRLGGVDGSKISEVRLVGGSTSGAVFISDVALSGPGVGTPGAGTLPTLTVVETRVAEGNGPGIALVPVRLSAPAAAPVTVLLETVGGGGVGPQSTARTLTLPAGQTCTTFAVALRGDRAASDQPERGVTLTPSALSGAIASSPTSRLLVREDDGVDGAPRLPRETAVRTDPCGRQSSDIFIDVPVGTEHHQEMAWLGATGVTTGWSTATGAEYRPLAPVNRDAMAAFLYRFAGSPAVTLPASSPFLDVAADNLYYKEIVWLSQQGISTGWPVVGGSEFRPLQPVNRDAMAAFLYRFAGRPAPGGGANPFTDVAPGVQHRAEMLWLASAAVSQGWTLADGTRQYRPLQPVTRDAMAAFLERLTRIP